MRRVGSKPATVATPAGGKEGRPQERGPARQRDSFVGPRKEGGPRKKHSEEKEFRDLL